jgi:hypothetical protein
MSIYTLYVKTHIVTGLRYLGFTTSQDPHKYSGSGTRWLNHLNKHGYNYTTEIIKQCQSKEELKEWGLYYSTLWKVVDSNEWANLKEEAGDGGRQSEESRKKMSESKKGSIPWNKGKTGIYTETTLTKISIASKNRRHSAETKIKMSVADRSSYKRVAPVSDVTKEKLSNILKGKPGRATGSKWTNEQKESLSQKRIGSPCPTKGMKRVYREDGSFYFEKKTQK